MFGCAGDLIFLNLKEGTLDASPFDNHLVNSFSYHCCLEMFTFCLGTIDVGYLIKIWLFSILTFYFSHSITDWLCGVFTNLNGKWNWTCFTCFSNFFDTSSDLDNLIHWLCCHARLYKRTRCFFSIYFRYRVAICSLSLLTWLNKLGCPCRKLVWKLFASIVIDWLCLVYKFSCFNNWCGTSDTNNTVDSICNLVLWNDHSTILVTVLIAYQEGPDHLTWSSFLFNNTCSCWKSIVSDINRLKWYINLLIHCTFGHLRSTDYYDFVNNLWIFDFWDFFAWNFDIALIGNFIGCCYGTWWADLSNLAVAFWLGLILFNDLVEVFFFYSNYGFNRFNYT